MSLRKIVERGPRLLQYKHHGSSSSIRFGVGSVQGDREYQEDRSQHVVVSASGAHHYAQLFSVHDGHGGSEAVDKIVAWLAEKKHLSGVKDLHMAWDMKEDKRVDFMSNMYYEMMEEIRKERSGTVSVSALSVPDAIFLAWVGDCQGCVFGNEDSGVNGRCCKAIIVVDEECHEIDFCFAHPKHKTVRTCPNAETSPHCFSSIPQLHVVSRTNLTKSEAFDKLKESKVEIYNTIEKEYVIRFEDEKSNIEWKKVQQAHSMEHVRVDTTVLLIGDQKLQVDARIAGCVQPTRTMGDWHERMALRHPTVMRMLRQENKAYNIALCSDGVFSRGAFEDMESLCQCLLNPIHFIKHHFYHRGQEITERLIACGKLFSPSYPSSSSHDDAKDPLWDSLSNIYSWQDFVRFLRQEHLAAVTSDKMFSTFMSTTNTPTSCDNTTTTTNDTNEVDESMTALWLRCFHNSVMSLRPRRCDQNAFHKSWVRACTLSIDWIEENTRDLEKHPRLRSSGCHMMANIAAHLAVIMGSGDNVTVLVARV